MRLLLVILLILILFGGVGGGYAGWYPHTYGYGGVGLIVLILLIARMI